MEVSQETIKNPIRPDIFIRDLRYHVSECTNNCDHYQSCACKKIHGGFLPKVAKK